jgi:hypothetical protein
LTEGFDALPAALTLLPAFAYGPRPSGVTPAERESD